MFKKISLLCGSGVMTLVPFAFPNILEDYSIYGILFFGVLFLSSLILTIKDILLSIKDKTSVNIVFENNSNFFDYMDSNRDGVHKIYKLRIVNQTKNSLQNCVLSVDIDGQNHIFEKGDFSLLPNKSKYIKVVRFLEDGDDDLIHLHLNHVFFRNEASVLKCDKIYHLKFSLIEEDEGIKVEEMFRVFVENKKLIFEKH